MKSETISKYLSSVGVSIQPPDVAVIVSILTDKTASLLRSLLVTWQWAMTVVLLTIWSLLSMPFYWLM